MNVRLLTSDGGFVVTGVIPSYNEPPGIIVWGERFFAYDVTDDESVHVYVEQFTAYLLEAN
jgi:hypothetical protein